MVELWLNLLESKSELNQPGLMFLKGALLVYQGRFTEAELWFKRVRHFCHDAGDREVLFQMGLQEVKIRRHYGDYRQCLKLLESLELEATDPFGAVAEELNLERANNLWLNGDLRQALFTLDLTAAGDEAAAGRYDDNLAAVYYLSGDHSKAAECFRKFGQTTPEPDGWRLDSSGLFMAGVYRDRGELSKAAHLIEEELRGRKRQKVRADLWFIYFQMAILRRDMGELESAGYYLDQAEKTFLRTDGDKLFLGLIHIFRCLLRAESGSLPNFQPSIDDAMKFFREKAASWQAIANYCAGMAAIRMQEVNFARLKFLTALTCAQKAGMKFFTAQSSGFLAGILRRAGDEGGSLQYGRECLRLSAAEQYRQPFRINPFLGEVLQIGLERGIELEFVHDILGKKTGSSAKEGCVNHNEPGGPVRFREEKPLQPAVRKLTKVKSAEPLRIFCFGEFEVYAGQNTGAPVSWRTNKAKELLAYFIHQRRPVSRQEVITALWPEVSPEQAATFLHTNLYWVRQILQKSGRNRGIFYENSAYRLEAKDIICDYLLFEELRDRVSRDAGEPAVADLEQAITLYRGDYLDHSGWEWALARREEYNREYLQMLHLIVARYFKLKNYRAALGYLEKILQVNPLLEEAHQMMMNAYAALGDRQAIIRQYELLRRILMDELGLEPARETSKLFYEAIGEVK